MSEANRAVEAIWRIEQAKLIAALARATRDVALAEELAQDALVAALETWPKSGVPERPGAWLMAVAKRRAIDVQRRNAMLQRKHEAIEQETDAYETPDLDAALDEEIGDDLLKLVFVSCHPVLPRDARAALTLRLIGGLSTDEIARAFLSNEPTIAQRIVRAKRTLKEKEIAFEVPRGAALAERLGSVLEVIYLIFNEGYSATTGDDWMRPQLCEEALRLGRMLAALAPNEPETHGLVALMAIQASRLNARADANGEPILLMDQNRARWDGMLIRNGLDALVRAEQSAAAINAALGPYTLQAEIAACHARARAADQTDWARIVSFYDALMAVAPSPVVALNRSVAIGMARGPQAGLDAADALAGEPSLKGYHLLQAVRGDLLQKLGRLEEAGAAFEAAAALTRNNREQALLLRRAADCRA